MSKDMGEDNRVIDRRMREILHLIREEDPEAEIPHDSIQIKWDHELLHNLGVLIPALKLKSKTSIDTQPLYEVPESERNSIEFYDHQQMVEHEEREYEPFSWQFSEDEMFQPTNVETYHDLDGWGAEGRRQEHPVPYVSQDGMFSRNMTAMDVLRLEGIETWAWYSPKEANKEWGIYVRVDAPEFIARTMFQDLEDRQDAWWLATSIILHHEFFHFLSQYHCDRISTTSPRELRYAGYDNHWINNPKKVLEEAAANGYAFSKLPKDEEIRSLARQFFEWMPEPYNRFEEFLPPTGPAVVAYQHAVRKSVDHTTLDELNKTLDSVFEPTPKFPVPVYFVNKAPKGHPSVRLLQFSSIDFGPDVRKRIRKNRVPPSVLKKLKKTIESLRGNSFDHVKHLFVMNSKSHFVQKNLPSAWRAIYTQVKGRSSWTVVFLGSHDEYEHYQQVKGL